MNKTISSISIHGFKSIKNLDDFSLKNLNIIIGANGAGKSNLIQLFRLIKAMMEHNLGKFVLERGGADNFLFNGPKITPSIEVTLAINNNAAESTGYRFELTPTVNETFLIKEFVRTPADTWVSMGSPIEESRFKNLRNKTVHNPIDDKDSTLLEPYLTLDDMIIYHFHDSSATAPMRRSEIIEDNLYLRGDASNIGPVLLRLRKDRPDRYNMIVNAIRTVIPFFDDFILDVQTLGSAEKVRLNWKQKGSDFPMQPYHLSDGSIRFICLTTALLQPLSPSITVIDEPELGLHPSAIIVLAELLQVAAARSQVIIATQSPILIDQFGVEDIIVANRKEEASIFERLNEDDFALWLEDYSLGELWVKNVLIGGPSYE